MSDEHRLSDADVERIADAVAKRLRDDGETSDRSAASERAPHTREQDDRGYRRPPEGGRGGRSRSGGARGDAGETRGGRIREDVADRPVDKCGLERLDGPQFASRTDRGNGIVLEAKLDEEGRATVPSALLEELDIEPGDSLRLTVHPPE